MYIFIYEIYTEYYSAIKAINIMAFFSNIILEIIIVSDVRKTNSNTI